MPAPRAINAHRRTVGVLVLVVAAMFGFGYALVPLYDLLCEITGFGGRTNNTALLIDQTGPQTVKTGHLITVEFIANLNIAAPWSFKPSVSKLQVHPGELMQTSYMATNLSGQAITGQAVPSVAPAESARFFKKIECFCFNRQDFQPAEQKEMPIVFRIDPKIPPHITTITLSYTFYRSPESDS